MNFQKKAFIQSLNKLNNAILNGHYSEAEDWLIAYERNLMTLVESFSKESIYEIIKDQIEEMTKQIQIINKQRDGQAIHRIKSLMTYQKSMILSS